MIKILTRREKIILYLTLTVVFFSLVFNLFIWPLVNKNINLSCQINITQTKLKKYLRLLAQKEYLQEKNNEFFAPLKSQDAQAAGMSVLTELEDLAKAAGIRIVDIRPQSVSKKTGYKEVIIDLRAEGDMEGYLKFIYNVESSLLLLRVKKFQLTTKSNARALDASFSIAQAQ